MSGDVLKELSLVTEIVDLKQKLAAEQKKSEQYRYALMEARGVISKALLLGSQPEGTCGQCPHPKECAIVRWCDRNEAIQPEGSQVAPEHPEDREQRLLRSDPAAQVAPGADEKKWGFPLAATLPPKACPFCGSTARHTCSVALGAALPPKVAPGADCIPREPTSKMLHAGIRESNRQYAHNVPWDSVRDIWYAMCDAALPPKEGG